MLAEAGEKRDEEDAGGEDGAALGIDRQRKTNRHFAASNRQREEVTSRKSNKKDRNF